MTSTNLLCCAVMDSAPPLTLEQINIVVRDMQKSLAFYRLLGVSIEPIRGAEWAEWARHHVNGTTANGVRVEQTMEPRPGRSDHERHRRPTPPLPG